MMMSVYNMILIRSYIESMPESLFEAAKIDGADGSDRIFPAGAAVVKTDSDD